MNLENLPLLAFSALALLLLVKILIWRELLALVRPRRTFTGREAEPSGALIGPLFAEREAELQALGFQLLQRSQLTFTPAIKLIHDELRLYRSADGLVLALVEVPLDFFGSGLALVQLLSRPARGDFLYRTDLLRRENFLYNRDENRFVDSFDLAELHAAHRELIKDKELLAWPATAETAAILNGAEELQTAENLRRGLLRQRPNGALPLGLRGCWASRRGPRSRASRPTTMPLIRIALFHWTHQQQRRRHFHLPQRVEWLFFAGTALLFLLLGTLYFGWRFALLLFLIILIHEGGHWLAMRLLGYRRVHMIFLPLIGGLALGEEERASASARAWIILMGPLPGLLLALALAAAYIYLPGFSAATERLGLSVLDLQSFISLSLFINCLNLLPVLPLDGGQLLQALLPRRALGWACALCLISMVVIGAVVLQTGLGYEVAPLLLLSLTSTAWQLWQLRRYVRRWRREEAQERAAGQPLTLNQPIWDFARALTVMYLEQPGREMNEARANLALELARTMGRPDLGWAGRLFFLSLWLGALAAAYSFYRSMGLWAI